MALSQRNLILSLLLSASLCVRSVNAEVKPEIELHFTVFGLQVPTGLEYSPTDTHSFSSLIFYSAHRSPLYSYRGSPLLKFYNTGNHSSFAAEYSVPEELHRALLLFVPTFPAIASTTQTFSIIGVDDSVDKIPTGKFAVLNLTGRNFEARYGKQSFSIPLGISAAVPSTSQKYLKLITEVDGKPTPVGGVQFGLEKRQRAIVVIFPAIAKTSVQPLVRVLYDESGLSDGAKRERAK